MKRLALLGTLLVMLALCPPPTYAQHPNPNPPPPTPTPPSLSDLWDTYKTHRHNASVAQDKIDHADARLLHKLLTDRFELNFKPQFGNTVPNILGNPTISTNQFTLKPDVLQLSYTLPFKEVFKGKNGGVYRYFLNCWEFGMSGGLGPKADKFALGQPAVTALNALQGTALVYVQFKVSIKDLRKARERTWDADLKTEQGERDQARDAFLEALLHRVEVPKAPGY